MNKFSAIVLMATILITMNVYGQERRGTSVPSSSANTTQRDSAGVKTRDKKIESAVKSDVENKNADSKSFCRNELLTWVGGGFSSLNYSPTFGDRNYRAGGLVGVGYGLHFNPHWSLGIGVELALYNTEMNVDDLRDSYSTKDQDGLAIDYYAEIDHFTEKQRLYTFNIPLWLQYQTPLGDTDHEFYAALGFKLGVPLSAKYKIDNAKFETYGYYEKWNQTFYDQIDLGYGDNSGKILQENLKFNPACMTMAEAGIKWTLNPKLNFYTGLYFDYGFNDVVKNHDTRFLEYNYQNPENFKNNSVLTSEYTQNGKTNDFMNRVSTVALGLKIRLGFNLCKPAQAKHPEIYDTNKTKTVVKKEPESVQKLRTIEYTEPENHQPYYISDPLLEAEMRRATIEYGNLADVLVLQVDGYEINQSKLSPIMEHMLDDKIRLLQKYNSNKYIIICEGHTCDLGREEFNLDLGQKRAEVIVEYLMGKGFNGENLLPTSKGETTPIVQNINEFNRKINRRVVFLIKEKRY